jgi:acetolactate synthase-1/2/3 large subunit
MSEGGGAAVVRALEDEGVPYAFGIPGTHNIELYDALEGSERVRPVLVTDERSASFMADGLWRASGRLGCVNLVPGAGLTHALSGIAEAYLDNVPMLVLACGIRGDTDHAFQLHDVDQRAIAAPVTKARLRPGGGSEIYHTLRHACRLARAGAPGPVMVEIPAEHYLIPASGADRVPADLPEIPDPDLRDRDVERAAGILDGAERPLLYLGLGAAPAGTEALVELAERLEAPVATTLQGKGVFPESHPLALWPGFGDAAPPFAREVASSCDATLAVGCRFAEVGTGSYGLEPPEPLVHVDVDPGVPGRNFEAELAAVADSAEFVPALLEALREKGAGGARRGPDGELRTRIAEGHRELRREWRRAEEGGGRVSPFHLLEALQEELGPRTAYATDSGNGTFLAAEGLRLDEPGRFLAPVDYSCMGYSVPAALGASLGRPDLHAVALAGDGAFLMTGLELLTAAAGGVPLLVLVLRDRELAQIAQFQETALGRKTASQLPDYDLEGLAHGVGVEYLYMADDEDVAPVLVRARELLEAGRPVLCGVEVDYSRKTYFTRGVVKTNFLRLPWRQRLRMVGRAVARRFTG